MPDHHLLQPTMFYWVVRILDVDPRHAQVTISKLSLDPLHPARAPLWTPSIKPGVSRCSFVGSNRHGVNQLYMVFKQVVWVSLVNSTGFRSSVVLPSKNQAGYSMLMFAMVWNDIATPSSSTFAFFQQKLVSWSEPGALQFFFLASTFGASLVLASRSSLMLWWERNSSIIITIIIVIIIIIQTLLRNSHKITQLFLSAVLA